MWNSRQKEAIEKGQLIHDLFAQINTRADVGRVLQNAKNEGLFASEEMEILQDTILQVITHPELNQFYAEGVKNVNERDIISEAGVLLRPDRLNFTSNGVSIIDYKTGAENPKHREQIKAYAEVLERMNFRINHKILVYINDSIRLSIV